MGESFGMTLVDIVTALVQQDAAENTVGVSVNNSDPYDITDISVTVDEETGKKTITLLAGIAN